MQQEQEEEQPRRELRKGDKLGRQGGSGIMTRKRRLPRCDFFASFRHPPSGPQVILGLTKVPFGEYMCFCFSPRIFKQILVCYRRIFYPLMCGSLVFLSDLLTMKVCLFVVLCCFCVCLILELLCSYMVLRSFVGLLFFCFGRSALG